MTKNFLTLLVIISSFYAQMAQSAEISAKGALSRSNIDRTQHESSFSGSGGIAFVLFPQLKLEARYIFRYSERNLQIYTADTYLSDVRTSKNIYSVGLSLDILSEKHAVQPYIYVGGGYVTSNSTFLATIQGVTASEATTTTEADPSANGGLGFRVRLARSVGFEVEAYAYATEFNKPEPLIDWFGSVGFRFYL